MSLKPMPGSGKSGTSRTCDLRSISHARRVYARCARRGAGTAPAPPARAPGGRRSRPGAAPGSASAARARRAPRAAPSRGRPPSGTRAGAAARCRSARASRTRPRCRRRSPSRSAGRPRRAARAARTPRARGRARGSMPARSRERLQVEPLLPLAERGHALPAPLLRRAGGELLADHAQRQELVALEAQDRLEPLDVVLAEEPVAALRALRRQQALVLEVADLRDRDVRELGLEAPAHGADREQPLAGRRCSGCLGRIHRSALEEGQAVLADLELVAVLELARTRRGGGSRTSR